MLVKNKRFFIQERKKKRKKEKKGKKSSSQSCLGGRKAVELTKWIQCTLSTDVKAECNARVRRQRQKLAGSLWSLSLTKWVSFRFSENPPHLKIKLVSTSDLHT